MFSVVTYSVPRCLLPFVQPSSLRTSSTELYLQGHSSLSLYPLHHSLPLYFAMGIFRYFCTFSHDFPNLEVAFFENACHCIALLHFLISFPVFWPCLSASHILTHSYCKLLSFLISSGNQESTQLNYALASGYLGTLLHQYTLCAKLLSAQVAAWCD